MSFFDDATFVDARRSTFTRVDGNINHHEYHIYVVGPTDSAALAKRLSESTTPPAKIILPDFSAQPGTEKLQEIFTISQDNQLHATQCLQRLADILYQEKRNEAMASFKMALDDFLKMGYLMGAAQCQKALADILYEQSKRIEAIDMLKLARDGFFLTGDHLAAAGCLLKWGEALSTSGNYIEAVEKISAALRELLQMGDQAGVEQCQHILASLPAIQPHFVTLVGVLNGFMSV